jgi:general stress protein 26
MATMTADPVVSDQEISLWLTAARETIADVRHCWLATRALDGGANARTVRINPGAPGSDEWTRRFICRRDSRKVSEIRQDPRVTLAFQTDTCNAYVALGGLASLVDDRTEMRTMWPVSSDKFYPGGFADSNMIVVRVTITRIEVHVRGITREPFGHGRYMIERNSGSGWRFVPA